jgi:hypothetical protein
MPSLNTGNAILSNAIAVDSSYNVSINGSIAIGAASASTFKAYIVGDVFGSTGFYTRNTADTFLGSSNNGSGIIVNGTTLVTKIVSGGNTVATFASTGAATFTQSGGSFSIDSNGQFISKQNLDVATAGGRFTGQSARGTMGTIQIDQATTGADGGNIKFNVCPSGSTTPAEVMRMTSGGNLLIGNITDNGSRVRIIGATNEWGIDLQGSTTTSQSYGILVRAGTNSSDRSFQVTNSASTSTYFVVRGDGNVGIGTSTPSYALDINDTSGSGVRGMRISTSSSSVGPSIILRYAPGGLTNWLIGTSQAVSNSLEFIASNSVSGDPGTAGTTRMLITSGGDVLVGATSVPSGAVSMGTGSVFINNNLYIGNTAGTGGYAVRFDGYANALYAIWQNASGTDQGGVYLSYGATSWTANSDLRLKDINGTIDNALDKIMTLRPVNFSWKSDETKKEMLGLIAQDVEKVFPQLIDENRDGYMGVRYQELVPVLIAAIQEQQAQIEELKQLIKNK